MKHEVRGAYVEGILKAKAFLDEIYPSFQTSLEILKAKAASSLLTPYRYFVVDYTRNKYLYTDSSKDSFLGYSLKYFNEAGPLFYVTLWNKADFEVLNKFIFPKTMSFLRSYQAPEQKNFYISLNYRLKDRKGNEYVIKQRSTIITTPEGVPITAIGLAENITGLLPDSRIIHRIEELDKKNEFATSMVIYNRIYFPNEEDALLTKREIEVLKWLCEGLSSKQIANRLNVSVYTVNNHRQNMLEKTNSGNSLELFKYALANGII